MTKPWEPTTKEIEDVYRAPGMHTLLSHIAVGHLFVKKYQEWLVSQCGPNPCDACDPYYQNICQDKEYEGKPRNECPDYREYVGQQAGLAKGLQERGK